MVSRKLRVPRHRGGGEKRGERVSGAGRERERESTHTRKVGGNTGEERGEEAGIYVHLEEALAVGLVLKTLAGDLSGVDDVVEDGIVDGGESAGAGSKKSRAWGQRCEEARGGEGSQGAAGADSGGKKTSPRTYWGRGCL